MLVRTEEAARQTYRLLHTSMTSGEAYYADRIRTLQQLRVTILRGVLRYPEMALINIITECHA